MTVPILAMERFRKRDSHMLVHKYPNRFENEYFFPLFSRKYVSKSSVLESFSPVHMKMLKQWRYSKITSPESFRF